MPTASTEEKREILSVPTGPLVVPALDSQRTVPLLSLVVPTLNEAHNIVAILRSTAAVLDGEIPGGYELIVVDDDSADGTWETAAQLANEIDAIRVLRRRGESGLASAVIRGWQVATGQVLGTINADLQHPPEVLACMLRELCTADLVLASRHVNGGGCGDWEIGRRIASWGARTVGRLTVPEVFSRVSDPLSGCYIVRREAIANIELNPVGYKTLIEILVRGRVHRIAECGYQMRRRQRGASKVGLRQHLEYLQHLLRLRRALRPDS